MFLLLREWLIPLGELPASVKLYHVPLFIAAMGSFLAIDLVRLPSALDIVVKGVSVFMWVAVFYYPHQFPLDGWWVTLADLFLADINALRQGAPELVSGAARTLLFLAGMAMLVYVLHSLVLLRKSMLWLTLLTVVYLLLLHAGYGLDTTASMARGLAAGLLLASLASLAGRLEQIPVVHGRWLRGWLAGAGLVIALCMGAGWGGYQLAPSVAEAMKLQDQNLALADLLPEAMKRKLDAPMQSAEEVRVTAYAGARSGYSSNDSSLGGPLIPDSGIVFAAWTEEVVYWRGESRNYYDGRGWSQSPNTLELASINRESLLENDAASVLLQSEPEEGRRVIVQQVLLTERAPANRLFAGGTIRQVEELVLKNGQPADPANLDIDLFTGASVLTSSTPLKQYSVEVMLPEREGELLISGYEPYPDTDWEAYLQLPASLPERVRQLAADLTIDYDNDYDKAKAIEHFLRTGYSYSLDMAVVPPAGEDFVDYFLFEHPLGYCDYFSTSMVVLLRSAGVPARWVKGFAPGEIRAAQPAGVDGLELSSFSGDGYLATVRNADAHSWPEVYLQEHGWVAFEPTPGFAELSRAENLNMTAENDNKYAADAEMLPGQSEQKEPPNGEADGTSGGASENRVFGSGKLHQFGSMLAGLLMAPVEAVPGFLKSHIATAAKCSAGIAIAILAVWGWKLLRSRQSQTSPAYIESGNPNRSRSARRGMKRLDELWLRLYKKRGPRLVHMTLREYVSALSLTEEETKRMAELASWDEQQRYGRRPSQSLPDSTMWRTWLAFIKGLAKPEKSRSRKAGS